jgi:hypothetical protein
MALDSEADDPEEGDDDNSRGERQDGTTACRALLSGQLGDQPALRP